MWWLANIPLAVADPGFVTLELGVHRGAGTTRDVAADGAAGQCTVLPAALHCPAAGTVSFRWGGDPGWVLDGATDLAPGETGRAWVLAADDRVAAAAARLEPGVVTPDAVREVAIRTGDNDPPPWSRGLLDALLALADHPEPAVRRELVAAMVPLWRHTASDPFPVGSPSLVPPGLLEQLASDPDRRVRRRLANRLRDVIAPGEPLAQEATTVLLGLVPEGGGVQRAAVSSLAIQSRVDPEVGPAAWSAAMARVVDPGPPGRAAANSLGRLASSVEPGPGIDPTEAVHRVYTHHRERTWRVWTAWRDEVPFDRSLAEGLLRDTIGYSPTLLRHWAETAPEGLSQVLVAWEPRSPHSDRYLVLLTALGPAADNLSLAVEGGGPP